MSNPAHYTKGFQVKQTIYKINSDNYDNAYMTAEAYKALTLTMSSGDHGAHKAIKVKSLPKGAELLTLNDIDPDAAIAKVLKTYPNDLQDYAAKASFRAGMSGGGLDSYSNYGGEDHGLFVVSVGTSRDADLLTEVNFKSALEMFGGETETVKVSRFSHWGCGWFEVIMIDPRDRKALETAHSIHKALEHYPVLDDSAYYEAEIERQGEDFESYQSDFERNMLSALGLDRDELEQSMSKAEFGRFESDLETLCRYAHEYAASYYGTEDAYVSEKNALEMIAGFEQSNGMISDLEYLGEYALACCGLELNPNYQPRSDYKAEYIPAIHKRVIAINGGSNE